MNELLQDVPVGIVFMVYPVAQEHGRLTIPNQFASFDCFLAIGVHRAISYATKVVN